MGVFPVFSANPYLYLYIAKLTICFVSSCHHLNITAAAGTRLNVSADNPFTFKKINL